jgi:hypothetical protein
MEKTTMPYKDPEKQKAARREWYAKHKQQAAERQRQRRTEKLIKEGFKPGERRPNANKGQSREGWRRLKKTFMEEEIMYRRESFARAREGDKTMLKLFRYRKPDAAVSTYLRGRTDPRLKNKNGVEPVDFQNEKQNFDLEPNPIDAPQDGPIQRSANDFS